MLGLSNLCKLAAYHKKVLSIGEKTRSLPGTWCPWNGLIHFHANWNCHHCTHCFPRKGTYLIYFVCDSQEQRENVTCVTMARDKWYSAVSLALYNKTDGISPGNVGSCG